MEYLLRHIPNDYIYKKNYLDKHSNEIEILILGSSEGYFGINPVYLSHHAFNAANVSQSLDLDYQIFMKYQNSLDGLKIVIIPVSYSILWYNLRSGLESWRIKNYAIYYGIDTQSASDRFEILNGKPGINIQRIYNFYVKNNYSISCSEFGWATTYKSEVVNNLDESGITTALRHSYKDLHSERRIKLFKENITALSSFAEYCDKNNIQVLFITFPAYYTYRERLNTEQLQLMNETINGLVKKHNNCLYINWFDNSDFVREDFFDVDHLNEIGAKKITEKLALCIDSLGILK